MNLSKKEYLTFKINERGEKMYHIKTPCKFLIKEVVIKELENNYLPEEEIGGVIWVKPVRTENKYEFIGDKITFLRNAIEDEQYEWEGTRKDSYLADDKERTVALKEIFNSGYLPIEFHTHPTKGNDFLTEFINFNYQRDTSEPDRKAAKSPLIIGGEKLLLPQGLVVGNNKIGENIFIGIYSGFIAPEGFKEAREEVIEANMEKAYDAASNIQLNDNQKILSGLLILLLLVVIVKYRKYSLPMILGLGAMLPTALENTGKQNKYYSQSLSGDVILEIPDYEEKLKEKEKEKRTDNNG